MLAYIFIVEGAEKITSYAGVVQYMQANGVDGRLLPLVILTELGGGLLVLFGLKTRWAAIALSGYCLLTVLFFHLGADQAIEFERTSRWPAGSWRSRYSAPAGGRSTPGAGEPSSDAGKRPSVRFASWPRAAALPCGGPRRGL